MIRKPLQWLVATIVTVTLGTVGSALACEGQTITQARSPVIEFFGEDGKTVSTLKGKDKPGSLNLKIVACDASNYYVLLPGGVPAGVRKGAVITDSEMKNLPPCKPETKKDIVTRAGNGAAGELCKPQ